MQRGESKAAYPVCVRNVVMRESFLPKKERYYKLQKKKSKKKEEKKGTTAHTQKLPDRTMAWPQRGPSGFLPLPPSVFIEISLPR